MKITLVMMVRDEEKTIEDTLRSWLPVADSVVVVDTGSVDRTRNLVARMCVEWIGTGSHSAHAFEQPWVDFATNRNQALAKASEEFPGTWLLTVDADTRIHGAEKLRAFLTTIHEDKSTDSFQLKTKCGNLTYPMHRIFRAGPLDWQFKGEAHEVPVHPAGALPGPIIPGCYQEYVGTDGGSERKRKAWREHLRLLSKELLKSASPRATFHAAMTHELLGELDEASELYALRWEMLDGYEPERWRAGLCWARIRVQQNMSPWIILWELAKIRPWRAEVWYELGRMALDGGNLQAALAYALVADGLPEPEHDPYMVETDVYSYRITILGARCYEALGDKNMALRWYRSLVLGDYSRIPEAEQVYVRQRIAILNGG